MRGRNVLAFGGTARPVWLEGGKRRVVGVWGWLHKVQWARVRSWDFMCNREALEEFLAGE